MHPITVTNQSTQLDKSLQMQNGNIQEIDDDNHPSSEHKIFHFHNCRIMDSFSTRTITMEKCGNKTLKLLIVRLIYFPVFLSSFNSLLTDQRVSGNGKNDKNPNHAISSNGMWVGYFPSPGKQFHHL